ncbi:hypothetical protein Tcan_00547, partial [Toxocara canis]
MPTFAAAFTHSSLSNICTQQIPGQTYYYLWHTDRGYQLSALFQHTDQTSRHPIISNDFQLSFISSCQPPSLFSIRTSMAASRAALLRISDSTSSSRFSFNERTLSNSFCLSIN